MKFAIGFAAGLAAAWAALAIWQRVPEFPDLDASEVPDVEVPEEFAAAGGWCAHDDPDVDSNGLWSGFGGGR